MLNKHAVIIMVVSAILMIGGPTWARDQKPDVVIYDGGGNTPPPMPDGHTPLRYPQDPKITLGKNGALYCVFHLRVGNVFTQQCMLMFTRSKVAHPLQWSQPVPILKGDSCTRFHVAAEIPT